MGAVKGIFWTIVSTILIARIVFIWLGTSEENRTKLSKSFWAFFIFILVLVAYNSMSWFGLTGAGTFGISNGSSGNSDLNSENPLDNTDALNQEDNDTIFYSQPVNVIDDDQ